MDNQTQKDIHLFVPPCDWGGDAIEDIRKVILDTKSYLTQLLRRPVNGIIVVMPSPIDKSPIVLSRTSPCDPYIIKLTARNCDWLKYAYQFAHEFCHVLSNYDQLQGNPNTWFHEAICALASVFTLHRMAGQWRTNPPYPKQEWKDYASVLDDKCQEWINRPETKLPEDIPLHSWLLHNEDMLRIADYKQKEERNKQHLVAYQLLPIFEGTPEGWNAIRKFPTSKGYLKDYLNEWHSLVDEEDKPFVARISGAFGYPIT